MSAAGGAVLQRLNPYPLPLQEIVGIGIPGGGSGVHGISISLHNVRSGATYVGKVTRWHDAAAPRAPCLALPIQA